MSSRIYPCVGAAALALWLLVFNVSDACAQQPPQSDAQAPAATSPAQVPAAPVPPPVAQPGATFTLQGRLYHSVTLAPVRDALVFVEELGRETRTDKEGVFTIENVPPGTYHLLITASGFAVQRREVVVTQAAPPPVLEVPVDPELHYTEVISVSAEARDQFETYQPTSVLAGQDLTKQLQANLGDTLEGQPGVTERSLGPGQSARPVIRGFDGERVLILEDGQRTGDLSAQSADHAVAINPAAASRIEVVRGPATLLYGSSAIGGLVNVITDLIPRRPVTRTSGGFTFDAGTAAREGGAAGAVTAGNGTWAVHVGANGRRSGDIDTPGGEVENTQSRMFMGNVGVSWTREHQYVGGSYGYDDTDHGVPLIESGLVTLTPRRHNISFRAGGEQLGGALSSYRITLGHKRYRHDELSGGEVHTRFENDTTELEVLAQHKAVGRLRGTVGSWLMNRDFAALGDEALAPPIGERGFAGFLFEELVWPHWTFQAGARVQHATYDPEEEHPSRNFTNLSASAGLLFTPPVAHDTVTLALSIAHTARHPSLEELYFFGPHAGNFAFEVGNPALESEKALGVDVSFRFRHSRASGEVTLFRNDISDYIFRNPITEEEFEEKYGHLENIPPGEEHTHDEELQFIEYRAADSVVQGFEAHADINVAPKWFVEAGVDYVRGTLKNLDAPLPRIPPFRLRGGLRYQAAALQVGGDVLGVAKQDRVFGAETPTPGYGLVKLFGTYSFPSGPADRIVHTITVRLDNVTDKLYRHHLSYIKDLVPEMGRNLKVVYSVQF